MNFGIDSGRNNSVFSKKHSRNLRKKNLIFRSTIDSGQIDDTCSGITLSTRKRMYRGFLKMCVSRVFLLSSFRSQPATLRRLVAPLPAHVSAEYSTRVHARLEHGRFVRAVAPLLGEVANRERSRQRRRVRLSVFSYSLTSLPNQI